MIRRLFFCFLTLALSVQFLSAQMVVGPDTLLGNEWIDYSKKHYKFSIDQDGVYRISSATMEAAGIPVGDLIGSNFRLFNKGNQVPLFVTTNGSFSSNDYIEFFGYKNRGEFDRFLFRNPDEEMLRPDHSLYTDRNVYYLTLSEEGTPSRVSVLPNDLVNAPLPESYYLQRQLISYTESLNDPYFRTGDGGAVSFSSYIHGEGFSKLNEINTIISIPSPGRYTAGPDATLRLRLTGANYAPHRFEILFNNTILDTIVINDLQMRERIYEIPVGILADINELKINSVNPQSRQSVAFAELIYPRQISVDPVSAISIIAEGGDGAQHFLLSGFSHDNIPPLLYSYDGKQKMTGHLDGSGNIEFLWPGSSADRRIEIVNAVNGISFITALEQKQFVDFSNDDTEFVVITHPDLMEPGDGSEYIQYRQSPAGGNYRAKAYSILDLYDQFGYGIEKHPLSIRNFVGFMERHWPSAQMIFIIGRGIEYNRSRYDGGAWEEGFFVPTYGRPGSDQLLAATLWDLVARYPIGRLAIVDQEGIANYLEKVREHDAARFAAQTIEDKMWFKNVMHLGGGKDANEQASFKSVLNSLGDDLAESDFGAKVHFFQKESQDIIGESQSAQILQLLNDGCNIINYLGHSASSTFEFSIHDPSEWENKGRYPVFSAMGCSAGQIHGTLFSLSDNYVHIPDEGAIAFISGSGSQFASALISWAEPWYDYIGNIHYEGTLGESILHGLRGVSNLVNPDFSTFNQARFLLEQQTFQGDPALRFHPMPGPDYVVDRSSVSITPELLNAKLDSFQLSFLISNIGRNVGETIAYRISIRQQSGQEVLLDTGSVVSTTFETKVTITLPLLTGGKAGAFRLLVELDPANLLTELPSPEAENNNELRDNLGVAGIQILVVDNVITAVYPPDFAIVTQSNPELVATGSNAFSKFQDVIIEIDTSALFDSPALHREKFIDHSATLKWSPQYSFIPGQVYYWRVSADSISPDQGYFWSKRSFIYEPGQVNGWNQSEFYQLTDNHTVQLLRDSSAQDFKFARIGRNFRMVNRYHNVDLGLVPLFYQDEKFNAKLSSTFRNQEVYGFVVAIDSTTGRYFMNPPGGLYGSVGLAIPMEGFAYNLKDPASRQNMINLMENVIPSGYYIFFYTYQHQGFPDYAPETWAEDEINFGKSIFSFIESQVPSSGIRTLATTGSKPYIILFQKDRGLIEEQIGENFDDVISISFEGGSSLADGKIISPLIGPASQWYSIQQNIITLEDTSGQNVLSAWVLDKTLSDTLWISHDLNAAEENISGIDAKQYPYLQLALQTGDSSSYHPSVIDYWRVLYEGTPEFIINADEGFVFEHDSLWQGQRMLLRTYVENISNYNADSVTIVLDVIAANNTTEELKYTIPQLAAHTNALVEFQKQTDELKGDYRLLMDVNPDQEIDESNYANNIGLLSMHVQGDDLNPVLDVTFDGQHILDGDLVSARPLIVIRLQDDNQFLRLDDTSSYQIYLQYPSENDPRLISFSEDWVQFIQANGGGQNISSVELRPELTEDGTYTLRVKAKDASGNLAGENDYFISFEVITAESISHLYNYPNPFSTATRFVYTLTGHASPSHYKIQIMSISGRVVREITQDELGPLTVGTHMTDYVWDGTDEHGERLAAGTYLYRMIVKNEDGEDYDRYETSGDQTFFRKGWGKLVILR